MQSRKEHPLLTDPLTTIAQTSGTTIPPAKNKVIQVTGKQQTKVLPRCVRWRLSLGLLAKPTHDCTKSIEEILKSIEDLNALKLRCQRSRYEDIETTHYWRSTPTSIADDTTMGGLDDKNGLKNSGSHLEGLHHVAPGDDPLSALVQSSSGKGLFGGNGIFGAKKPKSRSPSDSLRSSRNDGGEVACKGSRWSEFYNTREVLDVIEKDLDRLPSDHYTIFHQWRTRIEGKSYLDGGNLKRWRQESDEVVSGKDNNCHLKQDKAAESPFQKTETRVKSRANRNKSWNLGQMQKSSDIILAMVEDDKRKQEEDEKAAAIQASIKERAWRMSQILFVFARCHPEVGYRQGMHEVLSNVLLAFEMDMLEYVTFTERRRGRIGSCSSKGMDTDGCRAGVDSSGNIVVVRLLDPEYVLHDAFNLFECIMTSLAHAYDAIPAGDETAEFMLEEARTKRGEHFGTVMCDGSFGSVRMIIFANMLTVPSASLCF
jgi:hypothetical protein